MFERLSQRELELARVQEIGDIGGMRVELSGGFPSHALARIPAHPWIARGGRPRIPRGLGEAHSPGGSRAGRQALVRGSRRPVDHLRLGIPHRASERRRRAMDSRGRGDRARREGRAGRPGRRAYRHHRKEAGRGGGAGERGTAARDRRRPARPHFLHRPRPGFPLRQPDLRDLVRATAERDRRPPRRRGDDAGDVCGAAREPRAGAQGRGGLLRGRVSALGRRGVHRGRPCPPPRRARGGCSAFTWS